MIIVGLTGSIGMGKSTVTAMFEELGAAVWSADQAVHRLYAPGGAGAKALGAEFPEAITANGVDRARLSALVVDHPDRMRRLEAIIHPLVTADRQAFLEQAAARNAEIAVLDIPLLFERGYESQFDAVVVVTAPRDVQRTRVLARPGMTAQKFEALLARQTPDDQKRARSDYVVHTDGPLGETRKQVAGVMAALKSNAGKK